MLVRTHARHVHSVRLAREIVADHERIVPNAFQREDSEQLVCGILDVRALLPRLSFGNPEEAKESHHVIDAERTRVAETAPHEPDEVAVAVAPERSWVDRR